VIALDDDAHVAAAGLGDGTHHAGASMVVGGDRERPRTEGLVVLAQMACSCARRAQRIAALVQHAADLHQVVSPGRRHELPDAGGAELG
jgi:hypothetical protein